MPRILALRAVQRHTAASRSTRFSISGQHGSLGGFPIFSLRRSSTLAHTPSFRVSTGHLPFDAGPGLGLGCGGFGFGGAGYQQPPQALAKVKKRRLRPRKRAAVAGLLVAMARLTSCKLVYCKWLANT